MTAQVAPAGQERPLKRGVHIHDYANFRTNPSLEDCTRLVLGMDFSSIASVTFGPNLYPASTHRIAMAGVYVFARRRSEFQDDASCA